MTLVGVLFAFAILCKPVDPARIRAQDDSKEEDAQAHIDIDATETEEDSAYCWRIKEFFRKEKTYHFELDRNDQSTALELVRSKEDPRLKIDSGKEWEVTMADNSTELHWTLSAFDDSSTSEDISIFRDVAYIKRSADPDDDALEIVLTNGERESVKGGVYYPEEVMKATLGLYRENETFATSVDDLMKNATATNVASASFKKGSRIGRVAGGVVGGTAGTALGAGLGAFTGMMGVGFAVNVGLISIGSTMGMGAAVALTAAFIGAPFGALLLLPLGVGAGVFAGGKLGASPSAFNGWIKARRDLGLSASEKLFKELQCLRGMKRCSDGDTLVPDDKQCPA